MPSETGRPRKSAEASPLMRHTPGVIGEVVADDAQVLSELAAHGR